MSEPFDPFPRHIKEGCTVVTLPPDAFTDERFDAARAYLNALADGTYDGELHLDFAQITFLGSSALALLVALHRRTDD